MADLWAPMITTVGTLAGSFGGYLLAARTQRRAEDRKDARDRKAVLASRAIQLEDEHHEMQLTTLLSLQELLRRAARSTYLVIEEDRKTIAEYGGFRQLPESLNASEFDAGIEFHHAVTRVTNDTLREALEEFRYFCTAATMPPENHRFMVSSEAEALQTRRLSELANRVDTLGPLLGEQLRAEINRGARFGLNPSQLG